MKHFLKLLIPSLLLSLMSCINKENTITNLTMLKGGKTFAVPTGTIADQFVLKKFPDAEIKYFNSVLDCALAVKEGKADAAVYDKPILKNIAAKNEGLTVLSDLLFDDQYGFAVQLQNKELKTTVDSVLTELKADGTYAKMMKRWFPEKGNPLPMPQINFSVKNGVFKFGTAAVTEPMSYFDEKRNEVGFDIEFAAYVAKKLDKKLEIIDMEFGALLPALISGKVDMIGAGISITEERAKKVLFSECYYPSGIAALVQSAGKSLPSSINQKFKGIEDIKSKRIGVLIGSVHDTYATKKFPNATILQYQSLPDLMNALHSGKVETTFTDQSAVPEIISQNPSLGVLAKDIYSTPIAAGFNKEDQQLRIQFNTFLQKIKTNGIYNEMVDRWMKKNSFVMPEIPNSKTNGPLKVGIVSDIGSPFSFIQNGALIGFDIELSKRFASSIGKEFIAIDMPFGSLIASLSTKKINLITASMSVTEERKNQIDFSDPYFESGISLLAKKSNLVEVQPAKLKVLDDLADKNIGVVTGTVHDAFISNKYPKAEVKNFKGIPDMMLSLQTGKIDAGLLDMITAKLLCKRNPNLGILSTDVLNMPLGVGFSKKNPALRDKFNRFLTAAKLDGTYDSIYKRWFIEDAETAIMPSFKKPPTLEKLVVGVSVDDLPYVAFMKGDYVGFDIELIKTFAERENLQAEIITMDFSALVTALASGKVAMISDGMAITKERQKQIDFSDSYAEFKTAVVALNSSLTANDSNPSTSKTIPFMQTVRNSFYNNIILEKRYLLILDGLKITLLISLLASLLGTVIGGLICFMRMSKRKFLSVISKFFISLLRGTPVLVLLMIVYYVVFASVNINPVVVAIIAFGLNFGAYVSEMFRTSIESIDKGQDEAAIAGGFTKIQAFVHIIMPQAIRNVLPVYKGELISLIKMTSVVGYIAVQDLTKASDIIRSRTFDAFFPLIMVAVFYLILAWLLSWGLSRIELSVNPKRKRN